MGGASVTAITTCLVSILRFDSSMLVLGVNGFKEAAWAGNVFPGGRVSGNWKSVAMLYENQEPGNSAKKVQPTGRLKLATCCTTTLQTTAWKKETKEKGRNCATEERRRKIKERKGRWLYNPSSGHGDLRSHLQEALYCWTDWTLGKACPDTKPALVTSYQ